MSRISLFARHHLVVAVLLFGFFGQVPVAGDGLLLPDLQVLPSINLYIEMDKTTGDRSLRFDTTIINMGYGRLTLIGEYVPEIKKTRATQHIETSSGKPMQRVAGEFIHHPTHKHWHFENFMVYELWTYNDDGSLDQLLSSTNKMSYCMRDNLALFSGPPEKLPPRKYLPCDPVVQGISVGWGDTYYSSLPGQEINLANVPDGRYAIRANVDTENGIMELNDDNNSTTQYIEITGTNLEAVPDPRPLESRDLEPTWISRGGS